MIKHINHQNANVLSPFTAVKAWELYNNHNDDLVLLELFRSGVEYPDTFVSQDYIDYSGTPILNRDCNIALEQQEYDEAIYEEGVSGNGTFFPDAESQNDNGSFKRLVYDQIEKAFYNQYRNPLNIFGMENIDFPLSQTSRYLANQFLMFSIPRRIMGDRLVEGTIQMFDNNLDDNVEIRDDSYGNLIATRNLFSRIQEVGNFNNIFIPMDFPVADFIGTPLVGNIPLQVEFSNLSINANSYQWDFGDGITSTEVNPIHNYLVSKKYTVTLTASLVGFDQLYQDTETKIEYIDTQAVTDDSMNGVYYDNATANGNWDDADNWWLNSAHTIPSPGVPTNKNMVYIDGQVSNGSGNQRNYNFIVVGYLNRPLVFSITDLNRITSSMIQFWGNSYVTGDLKGIQETCLFVETSSNSGIVSASNIQFSQTSSNYEVVKGNVVGFSDISRNNGSITSSQVTFNSTALNQGTITSSLVVFNNTSSNYGQVLNSRQVYFNHLASNQNAGTVSSSYSIVFYGLAFNNGYCKSLNIDFNDTGSNQNNGVASASVYLTFRGNGYATCLLGFAGLYSPNSFQYLGSFTGCPTPPPLSPSIVWENWSNSVWENWSNSVWENITNNWETSLVWENITDNWEIIN